MAEEEESWEQVEVRVAEAIAEHVARARAGGALPPVAMRTRPGEAWGQANEFTRHVEDPGGVGRPEIIVIERRGEQDKRPALDVSNKAEATDWFRENLGGEKLEGYYVRDKALVRVPPTGTPEALDGKVLSEAERAELAAKEGPAQVVAVRASSLVAHVQEVLWPFVEKVDVEIPKGGTIPERKTKFRTHEMMPQLICQPIIDGAQHWRSVPKISAVTHTPMLRHDGSIITEPGYDTQSGVLYLPSADLELLDMPALGDITPGWVEWAAHTLWYLFQDFPFERESYRSNMFALLLTPLMRRAVSPPYPMWLLNAHQPGTGKSLLAKVSGTIHGIVHRPDLSPDDEEIRKGITSILTTTTAPIVNFDNITGTIKSGQIANLLTSGVWTDRPLGSTGTVEATNDRLWIATGNNIGIGGDMARRVLWVELDAATANPERRTGFAERDLKGYVEKSRGTLLTALLCVLGWWVQKGMPRVDMKRTDDYGDWYDAMAAILRGSGLDPGGTFGEDRHGGVGGPAVSEDVAELGALLEVIEELVGVGVPFMVRDLKRIGEGMGPGGAAAGLILDEALPSVTKIAYKDTWLTLGHYLKKCNKQFVGDTRVVKVAERKRVAVFQLEKSAK